MQTSFGLLVLNVNGLNSFLSLCFTNYMSFLQSLKKWEWSFDSAEFKFMYLLITLEEIPFGKWKEQSNKVWKEMMLEYFGKNLKHEDWGWVVGLKIHCEDWGRDLDSLLQGLIVKPHFYGKI